MKLISLILCSTTLLCWHIKPCRASAEKPQLDNGNITSLLTKSDLAEDIEDDYSDYGDDNEVNKQTRQRNQSSVDKVGTYYSWDRWGKWSKCATTCVQIRKRKCIERSKNSTDAATIERRFYPGNATIGCSGMLKRYRQCKEERCKTGKQRLRDEQCEKFNSVPYREAFYNWVGYEKEHDECMLFCRAVNSDLFISMNQSVTDGTPCNRPAVYYTLFYRRQAVCVEGICRAVHSSGLIRPVTTRDSQLKCGSVLCKHITEVYNKNLTKTYNHIETLPIGAMNLSIRKSMENNTNLLALRTQNETFLLNDDKNRLPENGLFSFNNDTFDYSPQNGLLTSRGPLSKEVSLMYFHNDSKSTENKVEYNYTIPISSASIIEEEELQAVWDATGRLINDTDTGYLQRLRERKRRRFSWKLLGFGECNRSCGPGTQTPIFRCVSAKESPTRFYSPKNCASIEKPTFNDDIYNCNRGLCPAFWRPSNFSDCQCAAGQEMGQRKRRFECMQEQIKGNVIQVPDRLCAVREEIAESCRCEGAKAEVYAEK